MPEPLDPAEEMAPEHQVWSWTEGDIDVELLVPSRLYRDFVGERTEEIGDGLVWFRDDGATHYLGTTGIEAPCDCYELKAVGGTEADRRDLLLDLADDLRWDRSLGRHRPPPAG